MTERIYYVEPATLEFEGLVRSSAPGEHGWEIILDRTAFYPTSGGQPHDTGELGATSVHDVREAPGDEVVHVTADPLQPGQRVRGRIDARRRTDHMQQHTGQHVLSAAFDRLHGVRTESFHLGAQVSTIDLAREVSPTEIREAEDEANRIAWEDRSVAIRFVSPDEASRLPLRKPPPKVGRLRVIDIHEFDLSACGGTHVARTGEIGLVAVRSWERFRGGTRLEFLCGRRALEGFRTLRDVVAEAVGSLSVAPAELGAGIDRLGQENKELKRQVKILSQRMTGYEAQAIMERADEHDGIRVACEAVAIADPGALKALAVACVAAPGRVALLVSHPAEPRAVVVAASEELAFDAASVLRTIVDRFGGRGGGRGPFAQGGGAAGSVDEILAAARQAIEHMLAASA